MNPIRIFLTLLVSLFLGTAMHAQCIEGDCHNGQGVYIFKNHSAKYNGSFYNGKPEGIGTCKYANGDAYNGYWKNGLFSGYGELVQKNGTSLQGIWENGKYAKVQQQSISKSESPIQTIKKAKRKTWALVVGVASYEHMPVLRYADDDAWLFYSNLISNSGAGISEAQVKILIDETATRENILAGLQDIKEKAGPEDLVLFYFSGHGYEGSFLPIDFDGFSNKLFHSEVNSLLGQMSAKQKICIADACHSGSLFAAKGQQQNQFVDMYLDLANSGSGTALILSSKSKETSLESRGLRHGVFTYFLVKGLKGSADIDQNGEIVLQELFDFIYKEVRMYTGKLQSPLLKGDFDPLFPIRSNLN